MKAKPYNHNVRPGWFPDDRLTVMEQNWSTFSSVLLETGNSTIVEKSTKDDFWGAKPNTDGRLIGHNVLGQLLSSLREIYLGEDECRPIREVQPLDLIDFNLYGEPVRTIEVAA